jgi:coproporphyrinogen III oxidase
MLKHLLMQLKVTEINMPSTYKEEFVDHIRQLQKKICLALEEIDQKQLFQQDKWSRPGGGGGLTMVMSEGKVFEKAGVNTSVVHGTLSPEMVSRLGVGSDKFFACGLSLVIHPINPFVPTVHANYRYFELYNDSGEIVDQWFGGGADLTPYYLFEDDAKHFHEVHKSLCDRFHESLYPRYKSACDKYFYNAHRHEARGIGGLFFDYLREDEELSLDQHFNFTKECGEVFLDAYTPIVVARNSNDYSPENKKWQEIRRGRYVEFNLIHDKGTLFGLRTNGRIESILMSLPAIARWEYDHHPEEGSAEEKLLEVLKSPRNWAYEEKT